MASIMRRSEVLAATGLCYTSIYNMEKRGDFPRRRSLTGRSVGWIRAEVEAWINGLDAVPADTSTQAPPLVPRDPLADFVLPAEYAISVN